MDFDQGFFSNMKFDYLHCFLCGIEFNKENESEEHVIPRWLQHKHDLWNQKLSLINKTTIPYRKLKIPCCKECNNVYLNNIEKEIERTSVSFEEFIKTDRRTIFIWLVKLYYGLLFKNLSLVVDFREPSKGTLVTPEQLAKYKMLHEFLQSTRTKTEFSNEVFSLFIFKLHLDPRNDRKYDFFFTDDLLRSQLAIQIGELGIICCIGEDGIIADAINDYVAPYQTHQITSVQFGELIAHIFYQRALLLVPPTYILMKGMGKSHIISNLSSFTGDYFREKSYSEFSHFLAFQLKRFNLKPEQLYFPDVDAVISFLINDKGELHLLNAMGETRSDIKVKHPNYKGEIFPARDIW